MSGVRAPERQNLGLFYIVTLFFIFHCLYFITQSNIFLQGFLCFVCAVCSRRLSLLQPLYWDLWLSQWRLCINVPEHTGVLRSFFCSSISCPCGFTGDGKCGIVTEQNNWQKTSSSAVVHWLHGGDCGNRWSTVLCEKCWVCLNLILNLIFLVAVKSISFLLKETKVFVGILHHVKLK